MYTLEITQDEWHTIWTIGFRYSWSEALMGSPIGPVDLDGENQLLEEHEAWELAEAFEFDTVGGHSAFPLLNPDSDLSRKLYEFWDSIV